MVNKLLLNVINHSTYFEFALTKPFFQYFIYIWYFNTFYYIWFFILISSIETIQVELNLFFYSSIQLVCIQRTFNGILSATSIFFDLLYYIIFNEKCSAFFILHLQLHRSLRNWKRQYFLYIVRELQVFDATTNWNSHRSKNDNVCLSRSEKYCSIVRLKILIFGLFERIQKRFINKIHRYLPYNK